MYSELENAVVHVRGWHIIGVDTACTDKILRVNWENPDNGHSSVAARYIIQQ